MHAAQFAKVPSKAFHVGEKNVLIQTFRYKFLGIFPNNPPISEIFDLHVCAGHVLLLLKSLLWLAEKTHTIIEVKIFLKHFINY